MSHEDGEAAAQADRRAVDRADHRQREAEHLLDDLGALAQAVVPGHRVVRERGDPVEVAAGGEGPPGAGQDDHLGVQVPGELRPDAGQRPVQVLVDRVQLVGPVDDDGADRAVSLDGQLGRQVIGVTHGATPTEPRQRLAEQTGQAAPAEPAASSPPASRSLQPAAGAAARCDATATTRAVSSQNPMAPCSWCATRNTVSAASTAASRSARASSTASAVPSCDAPQRVLGQLLHAAPLDLGVGELELDALERRQRLAELLRGRARGPGSGRSRGRACRAASSTADQPERDVLGPVAVGWLEVELGHERGFAGRSGQRPGRRPGCGGRPASPRPSGRAGRPPRPPADGRRPPRSPSASRSAGRASRSATGYGSAQ